MAAHSSANAAPCPRDGIVYVVVRAPNALRLLNVLASHAVVKTSCAFSPRLQLSHAPRGHAGTPTLHAASYPLSALQSPTAPQLP
eukprot:scaffold27613_cov36-Phaeocystis_antarctica.AAC.2